jgi:hypothetical protein
VTLRSSNEVTMEDDVDNGGHHICVRREAVTVTLRSTDKATMEAEVVAVSTMSDDEAQDKVKATKTMRSANESIMDLADSRCGNKSHTVALHHNINHKATWAAMMSIPDGGDGTLSDDGTNKIYDTQN